MLKIILAGLGFLASLCGTARGQELIGIDVTFGDVFRVDAKTGSSSYVGNTGLNRYLWHSMAKNSQGQVFAGYGDGFHAFAIDEIDPNTGQATFVVQTPLHGLIGLAFDDQDTLLATNDATPTIAGGPCDLYTIDLPTGQTQLVGTTGSTTIQGLAGC